MRSKLFCLSRPRLAVVLASISVAFLAAILPFGCAASREVPQAPAEAHLKALAVFYGRYVAQNRGQSPKDEQALKAFIQSLPEADRASLKTENVDSIFTSPRDGQPYVVRYGVPLGMPGPQGAPVIAHEQTGAGGERYVATSLGDVRLVDDEQFQQLTTENQ